MVRDLNTGQAYRTAYNKYIKDPTRQILLPIVPYMDGAVTGSFENLPVTAFKIALGIHNRTTRDNHWAWRIIGFLAEVMKEKAQGKKIYVKSKHMESETVDLLPGEGDRAAKAKKTDEVKDKQVKMNGFHTMI